MFNSEHSNIHNSGFHALGDGLTPDAINREQLYHLQQLVSTSAEGKEARHESFKEKYKRYKESYVKHLRFDPGKPDLSIVVINQTELTRWFFSFCYRACSPRGGLHFL